MRKQDLEKLIALATTLTEKIFVLNSADNTQSQNNALEAYLEILFSLLTTFPKINKHYPLALELIENIDVNRLKNIDTDKLFRKTAPKPA